MENLEHEKPEKDRPEADQNETDNGKSEQRLRSYQDKVLSAISCSAKKK